MRGKKAKMIFRSALLIIGDKPTAYVNKNKKELVFPVFDTLPDGTQKLREELKVYSHTSVMIPCTRKQYKQLKKAYRNHV